MDSLYLLTDNILQSLLTTAEWHCFLPPHAVPSTLSCASTTNHYWAIFSPGELPVITKPTAWKNVGIVGCAIERVDITTWNWGRCGILGCPADC